MDIKIPRWRIIRPQHVEQVGENIVRQLLKVNFWVGFIGWWTIWQWIKPYLELIKPFLGK